MKRKILHILFLYFIFNLNISIYSEPIENLIKQIDEYIKHPEKRVLDFTEPKYQRSKEQTIKYNNYKNRINNFRSLLRNFLEYYIFGNDPYTTEDLKQYKKLDLNEVKQYFINIKNDGKTLNTGDIIFSAPDIPYSIMVKKFTDNEFGHSGIIWIKNDVPYVVQVSPTIDYIVLPLAEFLFPSYPENLGFGIYQYTEKNDSVEMDYILNQMDENKNNIIFDPYALKNPDIENPETYFKNPTHLYCTELIEICYKFVYKKNDLLTPFRIKTASILNQFINENALFNAFFNEMDKQDNLTNNFIISPKNFSDSNYFKPLIVIKMVKK